MDKYEQDKKDNNLQAKIKQPLAKTHKIKITK